MTAIITGNGYRCTVSKYGTDYRVDYHLETEVIASFRWCENTQEVCELLEELEVL